MAYRLEPGLPVGDEVRRVAARQLELSIARLTEAGDVMRDGSIHAARRHIKKVRALVRLVRPALGARARGTDRRLRMVNQLLAPIADAQASVATLMRIALLSGDELPADTVAKIRAALVQRAALACEDAALADVFETAAALLRAERDAVADWQLSETGFRAIAGGLERTVRRSRRGLVTAMRRARLADVSSWRHRVKAHWLAVRLLDGRCGGRLSLDKRRLAALDGYLGHCQNCRIIRDVVTSESRLPPDDAARALRAVRRAGRELRRCALRLGLAIYHETPNDFLRRVRRLWHSTRQPSRVERRGTPWRSAA